MTEKKKVIREKSIKIRVTETELQALKDRCDGAELAPWVRETCLGDRTLKSANVPKVDPALLRQLSGLGNNLNQITRVVNTQNYDVVNVVQVLAQLSAIERQLGQIMAQYEISG
ncbi:MobC family plasmid mobilization relaxosome protein [Vibrio parahaemolyticus]|nr:MobC family plasmid mobilization relaxosome protein [Vibrio parahaemolyticus]